MKLATPAALFLNKHQLKLGTIRVLVSTHYTQHFYGADLRFDVETWVVNIRELSSIENYLMIMLNQFSYSFN